METILYAVIGIGVLLVIFGLVSQNKGHRRRSSDGDGGDSWNSDGSDGDSDGGSDGGSDSGCGGSCGGGGD